MDTEIELRPVTFTVEIIRLVDGDSLPGAWTEADYRQLLDALDFADAAALPVHEVEEMAVMALQELEPREAASLVLKMRIGDLMNAGQIQNASHELQEEPLWEEYPEMAAHERLFICASLLSRAFPQDFLAPEMRELEIRIEAKNLKPAAFARVNEEAWLLRLIAHGMDEDAILHRMFEDQLTGDPFPEAEFLLWKVLPQAETGHLIVQTSSHWLRGLPDEGSFTAALDWPEA